VKAIAACRDARTIAIDTAEVNGEPFIGVMGVGLDAYIAHRFEEAPARGMRTYMRIGLRALRQYEPEEYELTIDGDTFRERALIVAVANTAQYGNNARIAPNASVRDGLVDVVVLRRASAATFPLLAARLFHGTIDRARSVVTRRGKEIAIKRTAEGPAHLDGEPVMLPRDLQIRVRPQSLNVLVPASAKQI
jgi:diacylglycerol kinase family enzyme